MNYEKAYKEALAHARKNYETAQDLCECSQISVECFKNTLKNIFPELKESEDEKIRKGIIESLPKYGYLPQTSIKVEEAIGWLEKQVSPILWHDVSEKPEEQREILCEWRGSDDAVWHDVAFYHADTKTFWDGDQQIDDVVRWIYANETIEKQGEQKILGIGVEHPSGVLKECLDKVMPKFKVGDWVVNNYGDSWHIDSFDKKKYKVSDGEGNYNSYSIDHQDDMHLWTIADAKPGDVLTDSCQGFNNPFIFILKKFETVDFGLTRPSDFSSYCYLTMSDKQKFKEGAYHHTHDGIKPATKEQRDTLFAKMKEEGYEWDAEKKELKEIEDEEYDGEDYGIDSLWHAQRILEKTLGSVDGYQTDDGILDHKCAITAVKKLYEHKSVWSEEDEKIFRALSNALARISSNTRTDSTSINHSFFAEIDWLKSIKKKMKG